VQQPEERLFWSLNLTDWVAHFDHRKAEPPKAVVLEGRA
jgi:hypothetical protein